MCLIFLLIIMQRMVTSSTAAIKQSLSRRLDVLLRQATKLANLSEEDLADLDIEDGSEDALEAISLDMDEEIQQLQELIETAKQAEYQYPDVKIEKLEEIVDALLSEDPDQKIIIFTEFVATQEYLQDVMARKGYMVSILNGKMSIDERNEALRQFREKRNIFISTDAGGEGLNLQFSNIIINYDLPWNPMKIEQRCGRVDRIGQTRDVEIYNFIVKDTVENRVREVLEEKLSVILKEMGVDKYSDVLDSEAAEVDYTDVYMRSIGHPRTIEKNLQPVESEVKQQVQNARKYKDIIREEKDLTQLVGKEPNFDLDSALRRTITYYEEWKGEEPRLILDRLSISDGIFTEHLHATIRQDRYSPMLSVSIENFPNEAGYFMLWDLSVSEAGDARQILPIFINDNFILRPMAGRRIMEVFIDAHSRLHARTIPNVGSDIYASLEKKSMDFAYDTFVTLRDKQLKRNEEDYRKHKYALTLRTEAAGHIGIDNIRIARLRSLKNEEAQIEETYRKGQKLYPDFNLMFLCRLEG